MYRLYTAECLRILTETSAKNYGGEFVKLKFSEFLEPKEEKPEDERSGEEIAAELYERCGLKVVKETESV